MQRNKRRVLWRVIVALFMLGTFLGPWSYEDIDVPSEFPCSAGYIRLAEDRCSSPISGAWIFIWLLGGNIGSSMRLLLTGADWVDWGRVFLINLRYGLLLIPILSTLLFVLGVKSRSLRGLHLTAWILAALSALSFGIPEFTSIGWLLWGIWAYVLVAGAAIGYEVVLIYFEEANRPR